MATDRLSKRWTADEIPNLEGRTAVVTGANSGLGFETALELARKGAHVVLACRSKEKAEAAAAEIRARNTHASTEHIPLDLASLESVEAFADQCTTAHPHIDILCNNAGVMAIPRMETDDGFEMQLGTNHLGHWALTARLFPALASARNARVVNVSSTAHKMGKMDFEDLQSEKRYSRWPAYGQSKLANLLFTYEFDRQLRAARSDVVVAASHPGWAATELQFVAPRMTGSSLMVRMVELANGIFAQSAAMGALPTLRAATDERVSSGDYLGPDGFGETRGHPARVRSSARSHDGESARRLWERSEELTGLGFALA
jgi:NAD(P)-dependent dehydrogenase (short-subunit alcohol dehydrogenase family)